ncbi:hypothetical protein K443DRAFT_224902 [Laccaria amethystina LaAM-08-1]|uniref:WLM-domain-containing protein n=1 Tax=Laccaria amethystina LaAM-08-1 TaxID=1095629 RepID=A0A0C9X908_9AGAR|nr:hypothetical protein K443DRAFT_224902 [Laccaria amethystina LaAM-08-1]
MSDTFIQSFTHLKDRPNQDGALHILKKVASLVKPIMRKHGWVLPVLAEFFPDSPNLLGLNVNMGQQILIRLRPAHAPDTFYDQEDIVQTMLHELTHNVHGPHDDKFYKFLSGLQDEYDALQRSGYAGEGFFSKGQRLGTNVSHDLPPHLARAKALEAAEKRQRTSRVLGSGGRLGGRVDTKGKTPRELAAEAAERRARDEKSCGSQAGSALAQREAEKAAREGTENKVIDLTLDDDSDSDVIIVEDVPRPIAGPSSPSANKRQAGAAPNFVGPGSSLTLKPAPDRKDSVSSQRPRARSPPARSNSEWACQTCTLLNKPFALQCDVCMSKRPQDVSEGWTCLTCGEAGIEHQFWSCQFCGTIKTES